MISIRNFFSDRETAKDVLYMYILQAANYLVPLLVTPYLMYALGAAGYGIYGFSFAIIQYMMLIVDFGFNLSATKNIAGANENTVNKVFSSVVISKTALMILSFFIVALLLCFDKIKGYSMGIICFLPLLVGNTYTFTWLFQGLGKIKIISAISTLSKFLVLPLTFIFVKTANDVYKAIIIQSSVYILTSILSNIYLLVKKSVRVVAITVKDLIGTITDSAPLFLSTAATSVYTQLFTLILGFTCTKQIVGCYTAAERIMRSICFMFYLPISQVFYPKIAKVSKANIKAAYVMITKVLRVETALMIIVSCGLFFFANLVVKLLGESDYSSMSTVLRLMSIIPIAISGGAVLGQMGLVAIGDERSKKNFRNTYLVSSILSLLYVLFLSASFKLYGTVVALILSEYTVAFMMLYYFRSNKKRFLCSS